MRNMKIIFVLASLLILGYNVNSYTVGLGSPRIEEPSNIEEKYQVIREWSHSLKSKGVISIHPDSFAKAAIIVMWCESNLNTKSDSKGQQGLNQLLPLTRELIGAPKDIRNKSFREHLNYFESYLILTGKSQKIKCSIDLHALNFAPSRFHKEIFCNTTSGLKALDKNKDGVISREDLKIFQNKRIKSNTFIKNL